MKGKFINSTKTSEESSLALLCLKLTCDNAEKIDKQFQRLFFIY